MSFSSSYSYPPKYHNQRRHGQDWRNSSAGGTITSLPPEVHLLIISYLSYPDALALKHADSYFYSLVKTGVEAKVQWICQRSRLHLELPACSCRLRSDEAFCTKAIRRIMTKRRHHLECQPGKGGCLVVEGADCRGGGTWCTRAMLRVKYNTLWTWRDAVEVAIISHPSSSLSLSISPSLSSFFAMIFVFAAMILVRFVA